MESVWILRALWRRRVFVAVGALVALLLGLSVAYRVSLLPPGLQSRSTTAAFALERRLVDTSKSLAADADAPGAGSIVPRAIIMGDLLAGREARLAIAAEAGVPAGEVEIVGPGMTTPEVATLLAEEAVAVTAPKATYIVAVTEESALPILSIKASAPTHAAAAALAAATARNLTVVAAQAPQSDFSAVIKPMGKPRYGVLTTGPGMAKAAAVVLVVFVLWCWAALVLDRIGRRRRRSRPAPALAGQPL